jgi:TatD DNase family protein
MAHPKALAWGETGLDYHYDHSPREVQRRVFKRQLKMAVALNKPVVVHSRKAEDDTLEILSDNLPESWPIHLHCFTGTPAFAAGIISRFPNLYIGVTGALTFKNAGNIRASVQSVPLERLLLETDAPYMAPVPHRGKPSHCGHVPLIALEISSIKQCSVEAVYAAAWRNTQKLFGLPAPFKPPCPQ